MSKKNLKKANEIRTKLLLLASNEQIIKKKKAKKKNLMLINGKSSFEIDEQYSINLFEITMHQIINGGKNLCISSSSKIKPRTSIFINEQNNKSNILDEEINNSSQFISSHDIDSIKLQSKKKISEEKLKLKNYKELKKKNYNFYDIEKEKKRELQKKSIRFLRKFTKNIKDYLLSEKKKKTFKRQKTVSIQNQNFRNSIFEKNENENENLQNYEKKNSISCKGIIKLSKSSFSQKYGLQKNSEKKKTDNQKVKFASETKEYKKKNSNNHLFFPSFEKNNNKKEELINEDDVIFSSCNNVS